MKYFLACLLAILATPVLAASGVMIKDDDLKAAASAGAASVGRIDKGTTVEIVGRKGGWTRISSGGRLGWVRILSVRAGASAGGADLSGLIQAGTQRGDSSRVVATAGLRGLNEEELKAARFDANELLMLDRYQVDRVAAEQYARAVGLRQVEVGYLPAPQRESSAPKEAASPWGYP